MDIMSGQLADVNRHFGTVSSDACVVLAEGGSNGDKTFNGSFLVKIKRKGVYRFEDGIMTKRIK